MGERTVGPRWDDLAKAMNYAPVEGDYLFRFESVAEWVEMTHRVTNGKGHESCADSDWYNNRSFAEACQLARRGDQALVKAAEAILDKLETAAPETMRGEWTPSPAGAYPIVPEALNGSPFPMRELRRTASDCAPISIYVATSSSSGYDAKTLLNRGIAILALVSRLQMTRPVELFLVQTIESGRNGRRTGNYVMVTRVDTKPLDLAVGGALLADCGIDRRIGLGSVEALTRGAVQHGSIGWAKCYQTGTVPEYIGFGPEDLYIAPSYWGDELITKPVEWINAQLRRIRA